MDEDEALFCFEKIGQGLAHCHSKDVAHRSLSMEHVLLHTDGNEELVPKIIDFNCAMVAAGNRLSKTVCGGLSCIAPEMALGIAHLPKNADCWSLGVILLEMAGGLGGLSHAVPFNPAHVQLEVAATAIQRYFLLPGSQAQALAFMGNVRNAEVVEKLEMLLNPEFSERAALKDVIGIAG